MESDSQTVIICTINITRTGGKAWHSRIHLRDSQELGFGFWVYIHLRDSQELGFGFWVSGFGFISICEIHKSWV